MPHHLPNVSAILIKLTLTLGGTLTLFTHAAVAQIVPDQTLGHENSVVTPNLVINGINSDRLDGGAIRGSNLFHSFQEFNIENGRAAYFNNPDGITNILTRVTGANLSHILGKLGILGNANLFFVNPNGIVFGANSSLDLNGSFLATTASRIHFADGSQFNAKTPQNAPLLTVSVPIGLSFENNPSPINVVGAGHDLLGTSFTPIFRSGATGLRVPSGKTLALIGGNLNLVGGILTASSGQIELGSVSNGFVRFNPTASNWNFNYHLSG